MRVRLPLLPLGGVASRYGSALLARGGDRRPQVRLLPPPSAPRSSVDSEQWVSAPRAPVRIGPGCPCDATSFNGRTTGCYPGDAGSTPAVAAFMPRSSSGRGRRSLTPEARVRFPLGVLRHRSCASRADERKTLASKDFNGTGRLLSDASGLCGPVVSRVRRVRFPSRAPLAVAQWRAPRSYRGGTGVRLLPARLRRKACSEPAGCESVEQGATPWRRLDGARKC